MSTLLNGPLAQSIGWALVHLVWQGALVAGLLAATLALLRNRGANARYLASCAALALLVVMPVATAIRAYDAPHRDAATSPANTTVRDGELALDVTAAAPAADTDVWTERGQSFLASANEYLPLLVIAWLAGVGLLSMRLLYGWRVARQLARDATAAQPEWNAAVARLADAMQLRRAVTLYQSARVEVPTVVGWMRPVVLLPFATLAGLSREQVEMVLAHELAHIRRHDFFVNLMQAVVETLLFYHPAVWWISRQVRVERENCCDDLAIAVCGNPLQYARALTRLEELRIDPSVAVLAANGGSLIARIKRLVAARGEVNRTSRWTAGAALVTVLIALLVLPSPSLFAKKREEPQTPVAPPQAKKAESTFDVKASDDVDVDVDNDVDVDDSIDEAPEPPDVDVDVDVNVDPKIEIDVPDIDIDVPDTDDNDDDDDVVIQVPPVPPVPPASPVAALAAARAPMAMPATPAVPMVAPAPMPAPGPHPRVMIAPRVSVSPRVAGLNRVRVRTHDGDHKIGSGDKLTVDELISLAAMKVDAKYIDEMLGAGLKDLTYGGVVALKAQNIRGDYVREMRATGLKIDDADDIIALKATGVTPAYVRSIREAGYNDISTEEIIRLHATGITPEYVREMSKR